MFGRLWCAALLIAMAFSATARSEALRKVPILLDTDIGDDIDDAFALALALTSPELELRGITTVAGDAYTRALVVCRLLHEIGRDDVAVASAKPPREKPEFRGQLQYGLRPCFRKLPERETASEFYYRRLKAEPGQLTVVAVGPLTNVAELLRKHPECKPWIKRIVLMGGSLRVGLGSKPPAIPEWNIKSDIGAAQEVFRSGVPLVLAPLDATASVRLEEPMRRRIFDAGSSLTNQLRALYALWDQPTPVLFDPVAVALCFDERFCTMKNVRIEVDSKGMTQIVQGVPNVRVAESIDAGAFLEWIQDRLAPRGGSVPQRPVLATNLSQVIPRGNMPRRVHVIEDYQTEIERRWWLCGKPETKNVPAGSRRACRGVPTNDFDDRMGDPKALYTAVIFNPVPGPPMGKHTRLSFRYWLRGTTSLRVQIYSLTNGYHRHLTLCDLPQGTWQEAAVDMTAARRPDGSGGPLSENERIDDIQFYADADAELVIDDVVLYDAAVPEETRPFPRWPLFTAWFDTGRQGQEWPGDFAIVNHKPPLTWKAAKAVEDPKTGAAWIRLSLRGTRPLGKGTQVRFRYFLSGANAIRVELGQSAKAVATVALKGLHRDRWVDTTVDFGDLSGKAADEVRYLLPQGADLLVDDVLLFAAEGR